MNKLIKLSFALKESLEQIAKEEKRSVSNLIIVILEDYVKNLNIKKNE